VAPEPVWTRWQREKIPLKIHGNLPEPFGPITAVKDFRGPIETLPL